MPPPDTQQQHSHNSQSEALPQAEQRTNEPKVHLQARAQRTTVHLVPNNKVHNFSTDSTSTEPQSSTSLTTQQPQPTQTIQPSSAATITTTTPATGLTIPSTTPATPSQVFQALQTKATQHAQQPVHINTQTVGPEVQWQMVEQVPSNQQDKEEYERNKHEFKSWKGVLRYPAPPQQLWDRIQTELRQLCEEEHVPNLPQYEHKYISALLAALGPTVKQQIERIQFHVSEDQALWTMRLRRSNPPIMQQPCIFLISFSMEQKLEVCGTY